jgi:hypothetical protein
MQLFAEYTVGHCKAAGKASGSLCSCRRVSLEAHLTIVDFRNFSLDGIDSDSSSDKFLYSWMLECLNMSQQTLVYHRSRHTGAIRYRTTAILRRESQDLNAQFHRLSLEKVARLDASIRPCSCLGENDETIQISLG